MMFTNNLIHSLIYKYWQTNIDLVIDNVITGNMDDIPDK